MKNASSKNFNAMFLVIVIAGILIGAYLYSNGLRLW